MRGLKRKRHEDDTGKEAGQGKERNPGLKTVGDTHLKRKSWVGAGNCCGTEIWIREGPEAWTKEKTAGERNREGSRTREETETWIKKGG